MKDFNILNTEEVENVDSAKGSILDNVHSFYKKFWWAICILWLACWSYSFYKAGWLMLAVSVGQSLFMLMLASLSFYLKRDAKKYINWTIEMRFAPKWFVPIANLQIIIMGNLMFVIGYLGLVVLPFVHMIIVYKELY